MNKLAIMLLCAISWHAVAADQPDVLRAMPAQSASGVLQTSEQLQSASAPQQSEAQNPAETMPTIDEPHDYLAKKFVGMVKGIDRFFGDDRDYQESNKSVLQLDLSKLSGYGGSQQLVFSGRAKVDMPNTEKRLHLLIESNPDQNATGEPSLVQTTPIKDVSAPSSYGAGVRFEKSREDLWHFSTDAGIKFQGLSSSPFTRARASYAVPFEQWRMKLMETAFWFNNLGMGANSLLDLEHTLSESVLFRASSNVNWLHDSQNLDMRQDVTVYHTLDERRALLYQASAIGASQPQFHANDYVILMLYRSRLHQKWVYFEVSPQLHYPQIRNYQASPALSLRLEVLFDEAG
jgi:hypothetical protein